MKHWRNIRSFSRKTAERWISAGRLWPPFDPSRQFRLKNRCELEFEPSECVAHTRRCSLLRAFLITENNTDSGERERETPNKILYLRYLKSSRSGSSRKVCQQLRFYFSRFFSTFFKEKNSGSGDDVTFFLSRHIFERKKLLQFRRMKRKRERRESS